MRLLIVAAGDLSPLCQLWHDAIAPLIVRHPNRSSTILLRLVDAAHPTLTYSVDQTTDSTDPTKLMRTPFNISTINLTYFPGVRAAQAFIAAAHIGYLTHEALELVTIGDLKTRVFDPHAGDESVNPWNRAVRDGMPVHLTPETLVRALMVIMSETWARQVAGV